jgi:GntR family transcriptional regulator, transcriptional repressor for pyruvate dehydrogenase complex
MNNFKFERLSVRRTSDYVKEKICETILAGPLKTGDKLPTEKEMATQFGVSLVTLREALRSLETLGLIEKRKGHKGGNFISEIDNEAIKNSISYYLSFKKLSAEHLYEVRMVLEPIVIKLAVRKIKQEQVERLEKNVAFCEEKLRAMNGILHKKEFFELDQLNNKFHCMIAEGTQNPILNLTVDYIMDFLPECETKHLNVDISYCKQNIKDHRDILEAIKIKDEEECEKRMFYHLDRLSKYLTKSSSRPLKKTR